ncbi:MAG: restriction endonuclease subunit S, partial [Synergistaceae bacterium]|nr:restriction endonuclease subunit S [Synergistaceae bacterium]
MKLAEDLRRAVLQAAIEGSLTGGSRDNWRFVRLGEIGEIIGGGTPNTSKSENWVNGRIAWITPADMGTLKSKYISHGARHITEKGLASSSARIMPKGSIIFSSRAPIGYIAIAENDLCTNQGCKSVKLYDGVLSEYVYFALLAMRDDIKKMGSGTTFKEISGRVFSSVIIPLP